MSGGPAANGRACAGRGVEVVAEIDVEVRQRGLEEVVAEAVHVQDGAVRRPTRCEPLDQGGDDRSLCVLRQLDRLAGVGLSQHVGHSHGASLPGRSSLKVAEGRRCRSARSRPRCSARGSTGLRCCSGWRCQKPAGPRCSQLRRSTTAADPRSSPCRRPGSGWAHRARPGRRRDGDRHDHRLTQPGVGHCVLDVIPAGGRVLRPHGDADETDDDAENTVREDCRERCRAVRRVPPEAALRDGEPQGHPPPHNRTVCPIGR